MTTIAITYVNGPTDLHEHYQGQTKPQGCYVELDPSTGALRAGVDGEIGGGIPFSVYHRRILRWDIPCLTADAANELLSAIAPLAERVCAGFSEAWDGHNMRGRLDGDAVQAEDEIEALCAEDRFSEYDQVAVWEADDWFSGLGSLRAQTETLGITAETTDEDLEGIAKREEEAAESGVHGMHVDVLSGVLKHLTYLRDDCRAEEV